MNHQKTIVLIHGLWVSGWSFWWLARGFRRRGYRVETFCYPSMSQSLSKNADDLFAFLSSCQLTHVSLLGHSLGGMIVLDLLSRYELPDLDSAIIMGSPVNGSVAARAIGRTKRRQKLFGPSFSQLANGIDYTGKHVVGVLAGCGGLGMGQFFADVAKPHDGAVSVSEAHLPNCNEFKVLQNSHFSMLLSKEVIVAVDNFISSGKFNSSD